MHRRPLRTTVNGTDLEPLGRDGLTLVEKLDLPMARHDFPRVVEGPAGVAGDVRVHRAVPFVDARGRLGTRVLNRRMRDTRAQRHDLPVRRALDEHLNADLRTQADREVRPTRSREYRI